MMPRAVPRPRRVFIGQCTMSIMPSSLAASVGGVLPALRAGRNPLARRVAMRDGFPMLPGRFPVVGHMPAVALDELDLLREGERRFGPFFYWKTNGFWQL